MPYNQVGSNPQTSIGIYNDIGGGQINISGDAYFEHKNTLSKLKNILKPSHMSGAVRTECLEGTCTKFLNEINKWAQNTERPNIFLLMGGAGTGKSTIASTIVKERRNDSLPVCHLFFRRNKSDPDTIMQTIACDLAESNAAIAESIYAGLEGVGDPAKESLNTLFDILLCKPLTYVADTITQPILVVLDALDECGTPQTRNILFRILKTCLHSLPINIRFLITSRPENDILSFRNIKGIHVVELDNKSKDSRNDVYTYIHFELNELKDSGSLKVPDNWPWEDSLRELADSADGLFIWASTAVKFIGERTTKRFKRLEQLVDKRRTITLDDLYVTVLSQSLEWDEEEKQNFPLILSLILFSKSHLTGSDIDNILGLEPDTTVDILSCLQSLVLYGPSSEPNKPIQIRHASLYDYLVSCRGEKWFIDADIQGAKIVGRCFTVMEESLKFNIGELESSFILNEDIPGLEERIKNKIPSFLRYVCCYWAHHLRDVSYTEELRRRLQSFADRYLLFWFEVLSLTRKFNEYVGTALINAMTWIGPEDKGLAAFFQDAYMQATRFSEPILESTPHIYSSLLPLTRGESIVSDHYAPYSNTSIHAKYLGNKPRASCIRKIDTDGSSTFTSFSPDGTHIIAVSLVDWSDLSSSYAIYIWEAMSGNLLYEPRKIDGRYYNRFSFAQKGKYLAFITITGSIKILDVYTGELQRELLIGHLDENAFVTLSPDGKHLASSSNDNAIKLWDLTGQAEEYILEGHTSYVRSISFSSDSLHLASGSRDYKIIVWDIQEKMMKFSSDTQRDIYQISLSPSEKHVVLFRDDLVIHVCNTSTGEVAHVPTGGISMPVNSVRYSNDGSQIIAGHGDGTIKIWNASNLLEPPRQFEGHRSFVRSISFSPNGLQFVSSSDDRTIRIWDASGGETATYSRPGRITSTAISSSGRYIVSGSFDGYVYVWDTFNGSLVGGPFEGHTGTVSSIDISADEEYIASASDYDLSVKLWKMNGECSTLNGHKKYIKSVVFSPSSNFLATGSSDRTIRVWDVKRSNLVVEMICHSPVLLVVYSSDGKKIVSASKKIICIWDVDNGQLVSTFQVKGRSGFLGSVSYSDDGLYLIYGMHDGTVQVWNAENDENILITAREHEYRVSSISLSSDRKRIVSGSWDNTVCVWDALNGDLLLGPLVGHTEEVNSVSFFPDGDRVASGSGDGTIKIWSMKDVAWGLDRESGWITGMNKELWIWLPFELRDISRLCTPNNTMILNRSYCTRLDFSECKYGDEWKRLQRK